MVAVGGVSRRPTRFLVCFVTSSIPKVNFDIAMAISSFADASGALSLEVWFFIGFASVGGGYDSPDRMALAYSLGSKF